MSVDYVGVYMFLYIESVVLPRTPRRRGGAFSSVGFLVRPLRGRREREIQRPCPWTPLLKNLYLKGGGAAGVVCAQVTPPPGGRDNAVSQNNPSIFDPPFGR